MGVGHLPQAMLNGTLQMSPGLMNSHPGPVMHYHMSYYITHICHMPYIIYHTSIITYHIT